MGYMFAYCSQLTSLDLSNFITSNVTNMGCMFDGCSQLSFLDLSNFETSKVIYMFAMFDGCSTLTSLDLSSFNTSNVIDMDHMFSSCSKLSSLDLSNFETSKVIYMLAMFSFCVELTSLDLSNFNTSKAIFVDFMFFGCSKLEYINLKNFIGINSHLFLDNFFDVPDNVVLCLNENSTKILQEIQNKNCYTLDCSDDWKINQKKLVNKTDICFDIYNNSIFYKYEFHGLYYDNCINGNVTNNITINYCQCDNEKCLSCPEIPIVDDLCAECNNNNGYYELENDNNSYGYKKCYKDPIGYYLDKNESIYKKCYYSCKSCENKGDNITHNCIECNNNYPEKFKFNNYYSCFHNCIFYYYFDYNNNYYCTLNNFCPDEYPVLKGRECKKIDLIKGAIENLIKERMSKEEEIKYYDNILKNIQKIFTSKSYNISYLCNGNDEIIEMEKVKVILTTTQNQKNNINNNMTNIDLGECEIEIRQFYNLSNEEVIYIKMVEVIQEGMRIPKIEFDLYSKAYEDNLMQFNLSSCRNTKISLSIPVNNKDDIDKLNCSSGYYNNFCYTATTESGTDITLKDRKNEFPSKTVCQDDCDFVDFNYNSKNAKCLCKIKESSPTFADMKINKKKLLDNFKDLKNIANFNLFICVKVLFSKKGTTKNVGFFILIVIKLFHIISIFLFYLKELNSLKNKIKDIILSKNYLKSKKTEKKEEKQEKSEKSENQEKIEGIIKKIDKNEKEFKDNKIKYDKMNDNMVTDIVNKNEPENNTKMNEEKIKNFISIMEYNDEEMNNLSYDLALKNDKRSYWQYYISLIKTKHEVFYAFFYSNDYNSKIIKIYLFFLGLP